MILIQKSPRFLTANQIYNIINNHKWGFTTSITSAKIGALLSDELKRNDNHFMDCIESRKWKNGMVYRIP